MANYYGSITQASTALLGSEENGDPVHVPLKALLPMVEPNDIVFDGIILRLIYSMVLLFSFLLIFSVINITH